MLLACLLSIVAHTRPLCCVGSWRPHDHKQQQAHLTPIQAFIVMRGTAHFCLITLGRVHALVCSRQHAEAAYDVSATSLWRARASATMELKSHKHAQIITRCQVHPMQLLH